MKKFLEELKAWRDKNEIEEEDTEAKRTLHELHMKYRALVGSRALYYSKALKTSRVVTIIGTTPRYVMLEYSYYGPSYQGKLRTASTYLALFCGEDRLDVE